MRWDAILHRKYFFWFFNAARNLNPSSTTGASDFLFIPLIWIFRLSLQLQATATQNSRKTRAYDWVCCVFPAPHRFVQLAFANEESVARFMRSNERYRSLQYRRSVFRI